MKVAVHPGSLSDSSPWASWDEVPRDAALVASKGPFFLEIFAGAGGVAAAVKQLGVPCLPPIDIVAEGEVSSARDVQDEEFWTFIKELIRRGSVRFLHLGTPCSTFSMARAVKMKNGPRPLRSLEHPLGLPTLGAAEKQQALLGNTLLDKSVEAALAVLAEGGDFSLENPEKSLLWNMPPIQFLKIMYPTFVVSFDQCCFGSLHLKPTAVLTSQALLQALSARCKGGHKHVPLKGKVWNKKDREWVFRTKAAQVYPKPLCEAIAQKVSGVFFEDCPQFAQFSSAIVGRQTSTRDEQGLASAPTESLGHASSSSRLSAQARRSQAIAGCGVRAGGCHSLGSQRSSPLLHSTQAPG